MFFYTMGSTMMLTWIILIRPNNYTTRSNALDWFLMMSLFVFLPMAVAAVDRYQKRLKKARARIGKENRVRLDQAAARRYQKEMVSRSVSSKMYTGPEASADTYADERILYTEGYNRSRFRGSGQDRQHVAGRTQVA